MARLQPQQGTTLIEVLVSLLLLSVGLLGLAAAHARSTQTTVDAENRSAAALLANELISAMWLTHNSSNSTAVSAAFVNWQAVPARALPGGSYSVGTPDSNGAVRVTILWQAPGQQTASSSLTSQFFTTVAIP